MNKSSNGLKIRINHLFLILLISFLPIISLLAQTPPPTTQPAQDLLEGVLPMTDGKVNYSAVVEIPEAKKGELQARFHKWFADVNNEAKEAIQLDDKESGEMVVRTQFLIQWQSTFMDVVNVRVFLAIKVSFKDGKYRYQYTDFQVQNLIEGKLYLNPIETWNASRAKNRKKFFENVDVQVKAIIENMNIGMKKPIKGDW